MKKALLVASVASMIKMFNLDNISLLNELGYEVSVATNFEKPGGIPDVEGEKFKLMLQKNGIKTINICFERNPFSWKNLVAYNQIKNIMNSNKFDLIHCQSPVGGVITRISARKVRKKGTKVIYTAHGFHFFKGASKKNWLLFYPIEKFLSRFTDTLITINNEDYELAKKKFHCKDVQYVPGVGIDKNKFDIKMTKKEKTELRKSLGLTDNDFVMIYPAELSNRKRQIWLINTISSLLNNNKNIHLLLPGKDSLNGECQRLVDELGLENQIHFLGFRRDIPKLMRISNLAISSARQEGLPVNIMEAMYIGLPIVASKCRGNSDLISDGENGFLVELDDSNIFSNYIKELSENKVLSHKLSVGSSSIIKNYTLDKIMDYMIKIYKRG